MKTERTNKDAKKLIDACSKYKESLSEKLLELEIPRRNMDQGYGLDTRHSYYALGEEDTAIEALIQKRGGEQNLPLVAQKYRAVSTIMRALTDNSMPIETFATLFKRHEHILRKKPHDNDTVFLAIATPILEQQRSPQNKRIDSSKFFSPQKPKASPQKRQRKPSLLFSESKSTKKAKTTVKNTSRKPTKRIK